MNLIYQILKTAVFLLVVSVLLFSIPACSKYDVELERTEELLAINTWLESRYNVLSEDVETGDGIYYIHGKTGIGNSVTDNSADSVHIAFNASLLNNNKLAVVYSYTRDEPFTYFPESALVTGFYSGIAAMREGDTAVFIVPFDLGYGVADNGPIPGFSTLVFEINYIHVFKIDEEDTNMESNTYITEVN